MTEHHLKDIKEIGDSLYSTYLARDFFAKVLPGAIVLLALVEISIGVKDFLATFERLPFLGSLLIYGLCWAAGFLVQAMGEAPGIMKAFPDNKEEEFLERLAKFNAVNPSLADRVHG